MTMRPFRETIPLDEARAIVERTGEPIARTEQVPLDHALGRVVAQGVVASADVPPFSRAMMDGYAVRAADTEGASRSTPRTLRRISTLYTGQTPQVAVGSGECIEIATGAPMPDAADSVVMVEETDCDADGRVRVYAAAPPCQHVGRRGGDIQAGQTVLAAGEPINAGRLGALAATGAATVEVYRQPRVAILSTGNEIAEPGAPLAPSHVYNINRFTLAAIIADNGGIPVSYPAVPDTREALDAALARALEHDLVVLSGGSSVGERDLIADTLKAMGTLLFHGISVKPGKPTGFATVNGVPVFAMPGSPASCLMNAHVLLVPLLRRMARLVPRHAKTLQVPLSVRVVSTRDRHQLYTVSIVDGTAVPAFKTSGDITSLSKAEGYIEIPAGVESVERGSLVTVTLF